LRKQVINENGFNNNDIKTVNINIENKR